jgi:hypothetical protein
MTSTIVLAFLISSKLQYFGGTPPCTFIPQYLHQASQLVYLFLALGACCLQSPCSIPMLLNVALQSSLFPRGLIPIVPPNTQSRDLLVLAANIRTTMRYAFFERRGTSWSRPSDPPSTANTTKPDLSGLNDDVLRVLAEHVDQQDRLKLCVMSKSLKDACIPEIYRTVDLGAPFHGEVNRTGADSAIVKYDQPTF